MSAQIKTCLLLCSLSLFACKQPTQPNSVNHPPPPPENLPPSPYAHLANYIHHPLKTDTTCLEQLDSAEKQVKKGNIYFIVFPVQAIKHENELYRLCKKHGLQLSEIPDRCIHTDGQNDMCYYGYMDSVVEARFGKSFKSSLIKQASDMDILPSDTVESCDCDNKTDNGLNELDMDTTLRAEPGKKLSSKLKEEYRGSGIDMIVTFYVDTLGNASPFSTTEYSDALDKNYAYKNQLTDICVTRLNKIEKWPVGTVHGKKHVYKAYADIVFELPRE